MFCVVGAMWHCVRVVVGGGGFKALRKCLGSVSLSGSPHGEYWVMVAFMCCLDVASYTKLIDH